MDDKSNISNTQRIVLPEDYIGLFREAAATADVAEINRLWGLATAKQKAAMLTADNCYAFISAAGYGHLVAVNRLLEVATAEQKAVMLTTLDCSAFRWAARYGHLAVVNRLWELATDEQKAAMLAAENYYAFGWEAKNGHLAVVNRLWEFATDEQKAAMLAADNYYAFRLAAVYGHLAVVNRLWEIATPGQKAAMLAANNYDAFRWAAAHEHLAVANRLLELDPGLEEKLINLKDKYVNRALLALKRYDKINDLFIDKEVEQALFITNLFKKNVLTENPRNLLIESRKLEDLCILRKSSVSKDMLNTVHKEVANLRSACKDPLNELSSLRNTTSDKAKSAGNAPDNKSSNVTLPKGVAGHALSFLANLKPQYMKALFGRKSINHVERHVPLLPLEVDEADLNGVLIWAKEVLKNPSMSNSKDLKIVAGIGNKDGGMLMRLYDIHGHNELLKYRDDAALELKLREKRVIPSSQERQVATAAATTTSPIVSTKFLANAATGSATTLDYKFGSDGKIAPPLAKEVMQATAAPSVGTVASVDVKTLAAAPFSSAISSASSASAATATLSMTSLNSGATAQQTPGGSDVKGMPAAKTSDMKTEKMRAARNARFPGPSTQKVMNFIPF